MNNIPIKSKETFQIWIVISICLTISLIKYGKKLEREQYYNKAKATKKLGWTITFVVLLCIYITEKTIIITEERRLINSMIIFAGTFSYLYFLAQNNEL